MSDGDRSTSSYTLDRFGQRPLLGGVGGSLTAEGMATIYLTLNVVPNFVAVRGGGSTAVEIELRTEVALELFAQVECILAQLAELRGSPASPGAAPPPDRIVGSYKLAATASDDLVVIALPDRGNESSSVLLGVEFQTKLSESDAIELCRQLRLAVARKRAARGERLRKLL